MRFIICYDIKENRIRNRVVKYLEGRAFRIQFSVFSYSCSNREIAAVWRELLKITKSAEKPLLMIIPVCKACDKDILMHGSPLEEDSPLIIV